MANTRRVDKKLFSESHYLGKPADEADRIITRRIRLIENYPEFFTPGNTLIEVGCGSGATINRLASRFDHCTGVDLFDYSREFEQTRQKFKATNSIFRQLDLESEPIWEKFDRLICFEVIEHLRDEKKIGAITDTLKEGGIAAISVPNKWWVFETHGASLPLLPWNRVPFFSWLPRKLHEKYANARIYTKGRIKTLLTKNGMDILDTLYITAPMDVLKDGPLKRFLTKFVFRNDSTWIPVLSTSIFILAKKRSKDGK